MTFYILRYLIIVFLLLPEVQAQKKQTSLVFFEEEDLSTLIRNIIVQNKKCEKGIWYVEIKDSSNFLLSKSFLPNLIEQSYLRNSELYMTTIDNNIVFIITDSDYDVLFKKTFFRSKLPKFSDLDYVYFYDFSYWHLQRKNDLFVVIEEKIYGCR